MDRRKFLAAAAVAAVTGSTSAISAVLPSKNHYQLYHAPTSCELYFILPDGSLKHGWTCCCSKAVEVAAAWDATYEPPSKRLQSEEDIDALLKRICESPHDCENTVKSTPVPLERQVPAPGYDIITSRGVYAYTMDGILMTTITYATAAEAVAVTWKMYDYNHNGKRDKHLQEQRLLSEDGWDKVIL